MQRPIIYAAVLCLAASPLAAQQRRIAGPDEPIIPRQIVAPVSGNQLVGSWMGSMKLGDDIVPVSIDIEPEGNGYRTSMYTPNGAKHPTASSRLIKGMLQFTSPNSGGGFWVYDITKVRPDSLIGRVHLTEPPEGLVTDGPFMLVRMKP